ncbi:hypothetical protein ANO11243_046410 [Dothideomycetidae sp. 11243]|nr:hypothetical protein ANO11243_046410 [fungal sp. No.11243]
MRDVRKRDAESGGSGRSARVSSCSSLPPPAVPEPRTDWRRRGDESKGVEGVEGVAKCGRWRLHDSSATPNSFAFPHFHSLFHSARCDWLRRHWWLGVSRPHTPVPLPPLPLTLPLPLLLPTSTFCVHFNYHRRRHLHNRFSSSTPPSEYSPLKTLKSATIISVLRIISFCHPGLDLARPHLPPTSRALVLLRNSALDTMHATGALCKNMSRSHLL